MSSSFEASLISLLIRHASVRCEALTSASGKCVDCGACKAAGILEEISVILDEYNERKSV